MKTTFAALVVLIASFHLKAQSLESVIQLGHELSVLTVAASPDSSLVVTGSRDKSAKLWELSSGREVRSFLGHEGSINALDFSSDGKFLITSSGDKTAKIWEVLTGELVFTTPAAEKILTAVAISPDNRFFVTAGYPDEAVVWDWKSKEKITSIKVNADQGAGYGINLSFSKDGKWLAIGEDNRTANLYRTSDWMKVYTFQHDQGWCGGCATWVDFSPDGTLFLMASKGSPVKTYTLKDGAIKTRYAEDIDELRGASFSPDGERVMVVLEDSIRIWKLSGEEILHAHPDIGGKINEAHFTSDGKQLLLASDNNKAFVWSLSNQVVSQQLTGLLNQRDKGGISYDPNSYWDSYIAKYIRFKNNLMLSPDGKELIRGKFGAKVKRWDIASGRTTMEYVGHDKAALCYDLSADGQRMVTGGGDGKIIIWNLATGDSIQVIHAHREPIFDVHFTHQGDVVASASWDAMIGLFDVTTGQRLTRIDLDNNSVYNFLFHPNDLYMFIAKLDHSLQLVELDTKKVVRDFVGHTDVISSLQLSHDGKQLMSASWDGSIRLWDISSGLMTAKFKGHRGAVHAAIFSPDERTIYSAGADRIIRAFDAATGKVVRTFTGHQAEITSLVLGKDNKMLISHSLDGVTMFWDLSSGNEFFEHIQLGETDWMAKTPEGYFNGTEGARRYIHFVDGVKTYSVDQFFNDFYRPDLLPRIFQNRGGETMKGIQDKLKQSPPPRVKLAILPGEDPAHAEVYVRITDTGSGVGNLRLYHNGKQVPIDRQSLQLPRKKDEITVYKHVATLVHGNNIFSATAVNKDKVESDPSEAEVFSETGTKNSTCYIFSVGINKYKNPKMALNYARPDAESFGELVDAGSLSLFKKVELIPLYDEEASRVNILSKLDQLAEVIQQEDVFIFYYAGHGSMVDDQFYFIPSESSRLYDPASLKKEAIDAGLLQDKLKNIKALKQLIVMDACQSGGSVELLATRGATEEKAIAQLSRSAGIHVMASAGSEQFAAEFTELGHGLFTYLMIKALQGDADGSPKDGKVTIYELKSFLDDQVPEMTRKLKGKPQYPYTFSRGQDFPVVIEN